ncbi:MAG: LysM peptidoglycan-binding domain-containing protein [Verrucomicrobia bacterium]|nr:LysM peptidoglycan-binding domain-containing protein [Verrucomicrobiota bacterium]
MKLTHVFGLVVAVHAAVFTVIFATPGCRSTGKPKPRPEETSPANAGVTNAPVDNLAAIPVAAMSNDAINAGPAVSVPTVATTASVGAVAPVTGEATIHFAPTRPSAAVVAPVAAPVASSATHTVVKGDSLWTIAKKYGITTAELSAANKLAPSATLRLGQQLAVPARAAATPAVAGAMTDAANTYAVKPGDTLGAIARKHGTTAAALRTANNLSGDNLRVGQKLVIPGNAAPMTSSAATPSAPSPAATPSVAAPRAGGASHTIVPGDTLGSIARKYGVKAGEIGTLNNITDPAKLRVGQLLKLPSGARSEARPGTTPAIAAPAAPAVRDEPVLPVAPVGPVEGFTPVTPVSPVEPGAIPIIRIE